MRFAVLGPLRVIRDGVDVTPPAPKQRSMLAVLLAAEPRPVSSDRLIDAVWGRRPPPSCREQLRWHAHRLRARLGGDEALRRGPQGFWLAADDVDARRFERLCREASSTPDDPARVSRLLGEALGLWRGDAYDGVADAGMVDDEAVRLEHARLAALESRIEADLRLGRHGALAVELERLVAEHPLRDRFRSQLVRVLDREGRRDEALRTCRGNTERGHRSSVELRELERAILTEAGPATLAPNGLPPRGPLPWGRGDAAADLAGRLRRAGRSTTVVAVTGAAGVGKSALAVHVAHRLGARFPDGRLYVDLRGNRPGTTLSPATALRRLLAALDPPAGDAAILAVPADEPREPQGTPLLADGRARHPNYGFHGAPTHPAVDDTLGPQDSPCPVDGHESHPSHGPHEPTTHPATNATPEPQRFPRSADGHAWHPNRKAHGAPTPLAADGMLSSAPSRGRTRTDDERPSRPFDESPGALMRFADDDVPPPRGLEHPSAFGEFLGVDELSARFRTASSGRRLLIVLDNARDAAQLRPLLPSSPTCGVIITSRQPLATIAEATTLRLDAVKRLSGRAVRPPRPAACVGTR